MIFDGPNRLVILEASDSDAVAVVDIYSRWKDWVLGGTGAAYPEAFTTIGGDPLGGGVFLGSYFFLNTLAGWRIRPREANHTLALSGNLYPIQAGDPLFANTLGTYRVQIQLTVSSLTQAIEGSGGGGGGGITIVDVQTAMTLQGYSTRRAQFLEELDPNEPGSVPWLLAQLQLTCAGLSQALQRTIPLPYAAYAPLATVGVTEDPPQNSGDFGQAPPDLAQLPAAPPQTLPARYLFFPRIPLQGVRNGVNKAFTTELPFVSGDAVREVVYRSGVRVPYTDYRVNTATKTITFLRAPQVSDTLFLDAYVETI